MTATDHSFMQHALRLGRRNMGATAENPSVGCVIVDEAANPPRVVGRGCTGVGGRPHAETVALRHAGPAARGATAFVTLEPCSHHGETPPCTDALVEAGVARVVVAAGDPDPRVDGGGLKRLREAGITVEAGLCEDAARCDLAGFFSRVTLGRPHVIVKLAVSEDGKIAAGDGVQTAITGETALARTHVLRATSDAILVGRATAEVDDPQLTCRLPGLEERSPERIVLDSNLSLTPSAKLYQDAGVTPVRVYCLSDADKTRAERLRELGVTVESVPGSANGGVSIPAVLTALAARGIGRLLVEGGAKIASAFMQADLVDEFILFTAPKTLGPTATDALYELPIEAALESNGLRLASSLPCGDDRMDRYLRTG